MNLSVLRPTNISWTGGLHQARGVPERRAPGVLRRPPYGEAVCKRHQREQQQQQRAVCVFGFLVLIVQICIFWLLFVNQRRNPVSTRRARTGATSAVPLRRLPSPLTVGRKLHAEMGIAGGSGGGGGGLRESAEKGVEESVNVNSAD
ncbi:hypothetical protein GPALN_013365 [Globodera pallida]|nr:hypothetical protein GPALN_013365 [Globodera pallida]